MMKYPPYFEVNKFHCPTHEKTFHTTMLLADSAIGARFGWFKGTKAYHHFGRFEFRF